MGPRSALPLHAQERAVYLHPRALQPAGDALRIDGFFFTKSADLIHLKSLCALQLLRVRCLAEHLVVKLTTRAKTTVGKLRNQSSCPVELQKSLLDRVPMLQRRNNLNAVATDQAS